MGRLVVATMSGPARGRSGPEGGGEQLVDDVVEPALSDRFGDTASQVRFEDLAAHILEGALHRGELVEYVDAVAVVVDHTDHPFEVTDR
jgi:hypothetical protein